MPGQAGPDGTEQVVQAGVPVVVSAPDLPAPAAARVLDLHLGRGQGLRQRADRRAHVCTEKRSDGARRHTQFRAWYADNIVGGTRM